VYAKRVYVEPVIMEVAIPEFQVIFSRELRNAIIATGSYKVSDNRSVADAVLQVSITEQTRDSLARVSGDTGLSDVLSVEIYANYALEGTGGNTLSEGDSLVRGQILRNNGFAESFRQTTPSLAKSLAEDVVQSAFLSW